MGTQFVFEKTLQKIIPLVLHRITSQNQTQLFEDVDEKVFDYLMTKIGYLTATPSSLKGPLDDCEFKFFLTFDDGYESDFYRALPRLQKYSSKAIFFIVTDFINRPGYMSWEQVNKLHDAGMEIGSHSKSHINFSNVEDAVLKAELDYSKKFIEDKIGSYVASFSFPYGSYENIHVEMALESGFLNIFSSRHGFVNLEQNPFPRNSINRKTTITDIDRICAPHWQQQCSWLVEDLVKTSLKNIIGYERYKSLRNKITRN